VNGLIEQLAEALKRSDAAEVSRLIQLGANVNGRMPSGFPVMRFATSDSCLKLLIQSGADINGCLHRQVNWLYSSSLCDEAMVRKLLAVGANPNVVLKEGETAIFAAVNANRIDILTLLIQHGAQVNHQRDDGWTALYSAVIGSHVAIVDLIIRSGANVDLKTNGGDTAIFLAACVGNIECMELLLAAGADFDLARESDGARPIHGAAYFGNDAIIEALFRAGANIGAKTPNGKTAMQIAADEGRKTTYILLRKLWASTFPYGKG
jgi:ankyrin repeat protein